MRKFILKILIIFAITLVISYPLDVFISTNLKKSSHIASDEFSTWNAIIDGNLNSEMYIYGSSRGCFHFNPIIIEDSLGMPVYNLGINGHTFNIEYLRHKLALKYNKSPKYIILSLEPSALSKGNLFNQDQFLPYMLWDRTFYKYMSKFKGFVFLDYTIPLIRYYGNLKMINEAIRMYLNPKVNNNKIRIKGYEGKDMVWSSDFDNAKKRLKEYEIEIDNSTYDLFLQFLKECQQQNIKVILVYSPIYIDGQKFIKNQNDIIKIYQNIANEYNLEYLDYTQDSICYNKNYFYNAMHLNKTGAEIFTKNISHILKEKLN